MKTLKISWAAMVAVTLGLFAAAPAQADFWSINNDWELNNAFFGQWKVTNGPGAGAPGATAFVDNTANYFTGGSQQWISGYANAASAVFKVYDNNNPAANGGETVKPAGHNLDPGSGVIDKGDVAAVMGTGLTSTSWMVPDNGAGKFMSELEFYNVGTGAPAGNGTHTPYLYRTAPGGPVNPEGEPFYSVPNFSGTRVSTRARIRAHHLNVGQELVLVSNPIAQANNAQLHGYAEVTVTRAYEPTAPLAAGTNVNTGTFGPGGVGNISFSFADIGVQDLAGGGPGAGDSNGDAGNLYVGYSQRGEDDLPSSKLGRYSFAKAGGDIQTWTVDADEITLNGTVDVTLSYDDSGLTVAESLLGVFQDSGTGPATQLSLVSRDTVNNTITVQASSFAFSNADGLGFNALVLGAVPEPTTGLLFSIAGCALVLRRRRA